MIEKAQDLVVKYRAGHFENFHTAGNHHPGKLVRRFLFQRDYHRVALHFRRQLNDEVVDFWASKLTEKSRQLSKSTVAYAGL